VPGSQVAGLVGSSNTISRPSGARLTRAEPQGRLIEEQVPRCASRVTVWGSLERGLGYQQRMMPTRGCGDRHRPDPRV